MKILFLSTSNISISGGDTIQLVAEMNMWSIENEVTYLSHTKLFNSSIFSQLNVNVNVIFPTKKNGFNQPRLENDELIKHAIKMDSKSDFDYIICRGSKLLDIFYKEDPELYNTKVIAYITDIETLSKKNTKKLFINSFKNKVQSVQTQNYLEKHFNLSISNALIQPPLIENFNITGFEKIFDIAYVGKIGEGWGVLEYLCFLERNKEVNGVIVFSRIIKNFKDLDDIALIKKYLSELDNLTVFSNLTRNESLQILAQSKLSYCYRSDKIDNDDSFEISTKLLESMNLNIPVILRNTNLHREILGDDYPLFTNDISTLDEIILYGLNNFEKISDLNKKSLKYTSTETYKKVIKQLRGETNV